MPEQCQDNYANMASSAVAVGLLIFSEILPFIKSLEGNGLVHGMVAALSKKFPMREPRQPLNTDP